MELNWSWLKPRDESFKFTSKPSDYNKVKQLQEEAKSKGYTTSFVVAYNKKGEQIELEEALKSATN